MANKTKVYHFWNGKNIDGHSEVGYPNLIESEARHGSTEMKYEVSVDTFSADDLQPGITYDDM